MNTLLILNVVTCVAAFGAVAVLLRRARRDIADQDRFEKSKSNPRTSCDLAGSTHIYR